MGPCSRPGEDPNAWKQFGPEPEIEPRYWPGGRLDSEGFWVRDYGRGGGGRPPFWRTPSEPYKGLGPVTFKINTRHTLPLPRHPDGVASCSHSGVELWRSRTGKGSSGGRKKGVV